MFGFTSMNDDRNFKCDTCGCIVSRGIINISEHFVNCAGKGFYAALMDKAAEKNGKLTEEDVSELRNIHLKNSI